MVVQQPLSISLGLVLLISGCAPSLRWVRANTTDEATRTALAACALDAEGRVPFGGDEVSRSAHVTRLTRLCMQSQGYEQKEER